MRGEIPLDHHEAGSGEKRGFPYASPQSLVAYCSSIIWTGWDGEIDSILHHRLIPTCLVLGSAEHRDPRENPGGSSGLEGDGSSETGPGRSLEPFPCHLPSIPPPGSCVAWFLQLLLF